LDATTRKQLENFALERLAATADDVEQWSFLFRTEGAVSLIYCPWSATEDMDFDGDVDGLVLPWTPERLDLIKRGEADPDEEELRQWRQAMCRQMADGTDWCRGAWIVPLVVDQNTAGYALFVESDEDPDGSPVLSGVFDAIEDAEAAVAVEGAIYGAPDPTSELAGKSGDGSS
jgi:hypothetical protein